jgi:16S rRNA (adenine1518-N6/adenine1519-N6)-dimethyltransferase
MIVSKKSLGQNFLIDKNIIDKILNLTKIKGRDIIEIGPGKGALTEEILKRKPRSLIIIEKDFRLAEKLNQKYILNKFIKIYNEDILKFDIEKICKKNSAIFGNLPYNISSQILVKVIKLKKWPPNINDIVFMFQKELGEKIISKFPSSSYGRLSILTNYRLNVSEKFLVSPNCFRPKPKIISMVIHFKTKKEKLPSIKNIDNLEKVTNIFFSNKRKMINKNIKKILTESQIKKIKDLQINLRPADIMPSIYYKITQLYEMK